MTNATLCAVLENILITHDRKVADASAEYINVKCLHYKLLVKEVVFITAQYGPLVLSIVTAQFTC